MNRNDLDEALKNVDSDLIKESDRKQGGKKAWIGLGISAACIFLAAAVITTGLFVSRNKKISGDINDVTKNYSDGVIGERKPSSLDGRPEGVYYEGAYAAERIDSVTKADSGAAIKPGITYYGEEVYEAPIPDPGIIEKTTEITAGMLTAGEWRDIDDLSDWYKLIRDNNWYEYAQNRDLFTNKAVTVTVKNGNDPCFNVKVELKEGNNVISTGRTNIEGKVYLFYDLTKKGETPDKVAVNGSEYKLTSDNIEIEAKDAGVKLQEIDLMYMIDTTGSMGDELAYIQAELVDMVERISVKDEAVSIRVSVNFYRDEGDDYIVKYYDFRSDIKECLSQISQETATGGGDFPEAVHTALENAVSGHQWRNNALKLCFFILDAPPHEESEIRGINENLRNSLVLAANEGIRIIPVFCSGADQASEYLFRSFAVITNGTFIFLTNDSGIGGDHIETSVGEFTVERLNDCMVRVVCEYAGFEYVAPDTADSSQNQK
ncbi:MAG: VWA domain-containing protein [Clostridia bacterium]|nr:VWA domain-containing protein [Clostridia bacterium]